jgi:tetratricopeptide (TPR) repeat protein/predicted GNAT family acetyltransferase
VNEKAAVFLDEQTRMLRMQMEHLQEDQALHHRHLVLRYFGDRLRIGLQLLAIAFGLAVVIWLGAIVYGATGDHDLVIDAFSVPPDLAQRGFAGQVVASELLDKFGQMQASTVSFTQGAGAYRGEVNGTVKLEIPQTGVSIGELNRYLRSWLGHETHVAGEIVRMPAGLAITVRYGAQPGVTASGAEADFDSLMRKAAESLFAHARPFRYADYLTGHGRSEEAVAFLDPLTMTGGAADRSAALMSLGLVLRMRGDLAGSLRALGQAIGLNPRNANAYAATSVDETLLGHDQRSFESTLAALRYWRGGASQGQDQSASFVNNNPLVFEEFQAEDQGDFRRAAADASRFLAAGGWGNGSEQFAVMWRADDLMADHDLTAASEVGGGLPKTLESGAPNPYRPWTQLAISFYAGDWSSLVASARPVEPLILSASPVHARTQLWPWLSYAMAKTGDMAGAEALIAGTPLDCDLCLRTRGKIAAVKGDWPAADRWFAMVAARSPSIPFADSDWGDALLAKGAVAEFRLAHEKGPHFADPLKGWGDALTRQGQWNDALARYDEALKYAPVWRELRQARDAAARRQSLRPHGNLLAPAIGALGDRATLAATAKVWPNRKRGS